MINIQPNGIGISESSDTHRLNEWMKIGRNGTNMEL